MVKPESGRLLVVDDDIEFLTPLCEILSMTGYEVKGVTSGEDALVELKGQTYDLLLADLIIPRMDGVALLRAALEIDPHLIGIIITGHGTVQTAVEAMKVGAFDYILKPLDFKLLPLILSRAMGVRRLRIENLQLQETLEIYELKQALCESEKKYRAIFENTGTATGIIEEDTTISLVNTEFEKLSGYSKEEVEGKKNWTEFVVRDDLERVKDYFHPGVMNSSPPRSFEFHFVDRNGTVKDVFMNAAIIPGTKRSVASLSDITERKQAEEKMRAYQERLSSLASELSLIEERERRRIATDLHDNIGQNLAITKIKLGEMREALSDTDYTDFIDEIRMLVDKTIDYTRSLTFELSPPVLYEIGFEAAVEWLAEQIREKHGILVGFEDDGKPKLMDDEIRMLLYKAVRELLVNIVKHAQATKAKVSIQSNDDNNGIRITVEDNGVGFDTSKATPYGKTTGFGFGLFNIRERLESIGGYFEVKSEPGHGTQVTIVAPLKLTEN